MGRDGVFGAGQAFDHKISLNKAVMQIEGAASVMDGNKLREVADAMPSFVRCWWTTISSSSARCSNRRFATHCIM